MGKERFHSANPDKKLVDIPNLSPFDLMADNQSDGARELVLDWHHAKSTRKLKVVAACADARVGINKAVGTSETQNFRSIAASITTEKAKYIARHSGSDGIIVMNHYGGSVLRETGLPGGCGGRAAREQVVFSPDQEIDPEIGSFIKSYVSDGDLLIQTYETVDRLSSMSESKKPVLGVVIDHETSLITPVVYKRPGGSTIYAVNGEDVKNRNFQKIYESGTVPGIDLDLLPDDVLEMLERNRIAASELAEQYPDIQISQRTQDPKIIVLTTSTIPAGIRYPATFSRPNTGFVVFQPKEKIGGESFINPYDLDAVAPQLKYPISQNLSADEAGSPFYSTDTLLIETPDANQSEDIARELLEKYNWMRNWRLKGGNILVAQVNAGFTEDAKRFTK